MIGNDEVRDICFQFFVHIHQTKENDMTNHLMSDKDGPWWRRNTFSDRKAETVRLIRSVIGILTENHDFHFIQLTHSCKGEDMLDRRKDDYILFSLIGNKIRQLSRSQELWKQGIETFAVLYLLKVIFGEFLLKGFIPRHAHVRDKTAWCFCLELHFRRQAVLLDSFGDKFLFFCFRHAGRTDIGTRLRHL